MSRLFLPTRFLCYVFKLANSSRFSTVEHLKCFETKYWLNEYIHIYIYKYWPRIPDRNITAFIQNGEKSFESQTPSGSGFSVRFNEKKVCRAKKRKREYIKSHGSHQNRI